MANKIIKKIFIGGCIAVIVICMIPIAKKLMEYKKSRDTYKEIRSEAIITPPEEPKPQSDSTSESEPPVVIENLLGIDWSPLTGTEAVAWLQAENISYPVMYSLNDGYYSHRLPDQSYNYGGSLYLFVGNQKDLSDKNSIIYGHNMADGSMFGTLKQYLNADHANRKFYLYTPDGRRKEYTLYAVIRADKGERDLYTYGFASDESFMEWQKMIKNRSVYVTGPEAKKDARYVTLSTCNGYAGTRNRLLVIGQETNDIVIPKNAVKG